jgi:hypothetical protein
VGLSASFICAVCGKKHPGLVTNWGYKLPDAVWDIPEPERSEKAIFDTDLCEFEERRFIRCILFVPFSEASGEFGWGAWAEVERPIFERYLQFYDKDGSMEPASVGFLANALPPYQHSLGAAVDIQFGNASQRPSLHLPIGDKSRIAAEQRDGISEVRYHEILGALHS